MNRILDGVANGLDDALLVVKDDTTHAEGPGGEYILRFVIDEHNRARVGGGIVEDVSVKPEVGFPLPCVGGSIDFIEQRPVCRPRPKIVVIGMGDVGHGIHPELTTRLVLEFANEVEHLVIWSERVTGLVKGIRDFGRGDVELV